MIRIKTIDIGFDLGSASYVQVEVQPDRASTGFTLNFDLQGHAELSAAVARLRQEVDLLVRDVVRGWTE